MALDSLEKRRNVVGVGRPWMRGGTTPGTNDEQKRAEIGNVYGGNALSPGVGTNRLLLIHPPGVHGGFRK